MHWKLKFQTSRCLFKNRRRCLGGLLLKLDYRIRANKKKSREKGGLCLVTTRLLVTAEVYWTTNRNINCCYPAQSTILPSCLYYGCSWLGWISGSISKLRFLEQERLLPSKESLYLTCPTVVFFIESEKSFEFVHQICVNFEPYLTYLRDSYVIYYLNSSRPIL